MFKANLDVANVKKSHATSHFFLHVVQSCVFCWRSSKNSKLTEVDENSGINKYLVDIFVLDAIYTPTRRDADE